MVTPDSDPPEDEQPPFSPHDETLVQDSALVPFPGDRTIIDPDSGTHFDPTAQTLITPTFIPPGGAPGEPPPPAVDREGNTIYDAALAASIDAPDSAVVPHHDTRVDVEPEPASHDSVPSAPATGKHGRPGGRPATASLHPPPPSGVPDTLVYPQTEDGGGSRLEGSLVSVSRTASGRLAKPRSRLPDQIAHYRILSELGRGGMGVVYEAMNVRTERRVALKVLLMGASDKEVARFQVEARAAGRLRHPNVVEVLEMDHDDHGGWYLAMDMIDGESLNERVKREGPLEEREAAAIALKMTRALEHAHERSILHRDVKPQNILLNEAGEPLLTDFGLAKLTEETAASLTGHGAHMMGTPGYMPPEQAGAGDGPDARSDVYGLGATLYFMLTGQPPFTGKTGANIIYALIHSSPKAPSKRRAGLDPDLETICLQCLEKEKAHRYPDAAALAADLERYLAEEQIEATRPPAAVRFLRWAGRNKPKAAVLASVLTLLVAGAAFGAKAFVERQQFQREVTATREKLQTDRKEQEAELAAEEQRRKAKLAQEEQKVEEKQAKLDAIPPKVRVLQPTEAARVTSRTALAVRVFVGDADLASVTLDGAPLKPTAEKGFFEGSWALGQEGRNEVTIVARDEAGNETKVPLAATRDTTAPRPTVRWKAAGSKVEDEDQTEATELALTVSSDEPGRVTVAAVHAGVSTRLVDKAPIDAKPLRVRVALGLGVNKLAITLRDALGNQRVAVHSVERLAPRVLRGAWWSPRGAQRDHAISAGRPVWIKNSLGMRFALIPPGTFRMGSPPAERGRANNEYPHDVRIRRAFYMSELEVTNAQFRRLFPKHTSGVAKGSYRPPRQAKPWSITLDADGLPAVKVTWEQAVAFCAKLGAAEGAPGRYRLPTEAEWEYACRAGTRTPWFWGADPLRAEPFANVADEETNQRLNLGRPAHDRGKLWFDLTDKYPLVAPAGSLRPNPFGLRDMVGNVAEWCADVFQNVFVGVKPGQVISDPTGPRAPIGRPGLLRVIRGGAWNDRPAWTRSARRTGWPQNQPLRTIGFRIVRVTND